MKRALFTVLAYTVFLGVSMNAFAQETSQTVIPLGGLDAVALIEGREVQGKEEFSAIEEAGGLGGAMNTRFRRPL